MIQIFSFIIRYRIPLAIIAAIIAAYGYGAYQHNAGYYKGYAACDSAYIAAKEAENNESRKGVDDVAKKERSLDQRKLDDGLCSLGIVQQNGGCK